MKRAKLRIHKDERPRPPRAASVVHRPRLPFLLDRKRIRVLPNAHFLDRSHFDGTDTPLSRPVSHGRGISNCTCQLFFTNLPTASVAGLLPAGLTLAPNLSAYPDLHPVIQMLCKQSGTSWILNGIAQGVGPQYEEMILLVPFVWKGANPQLHAFVVRMYLTDQIAVDVGNVHYGYAKKRADVAIPANDAVVRHGGNTALVAEFQKTGADVPCNAAGVPANYAKMREILALPVLGLVSPPPPFPPFYVRSYFDWDHTGATVAPMRCDFRYFGAFTPGMPSQPLAHVADGAFWLTDIKWTIEWPGERV